MDVQTIRYDPGPVRAVILAGGEGTRLRPLTLATPKPVVPVVDRPLLQHQLDLLARVGVRDIVFSVAYRPERVQTVFGDGSSVGRRILYAVEDTPLGTGGAAAPLGERGGDGAVDQARASWMVVKTSSMDVCVAPRATIDATEISERMRAYSTRP